jgi:phage baseplate assembly protein gpV
MVDVYVPRCEIEVAGTTLSADISSQVISVSYENSLDLADTFSIAIRNADNRLLDSALFDIGKSVRIYMGYGNDLEPMLWGEIASLETVFPENGAPRLRITGYDRSYRLRHNQPGRTFRFQNPSMIAGQIALEAGLIPVVDPVPALPEVEHHQQTSDFGLLKMMAEPFFMDVYVRWNRLHFQFPRPPGQAVALDWGRNLSSFSPRISTEGQTGILIIRGYNQELAQSIVAFALAADFDQEHIQERLGSAAMDALLAIGRQVVNDRSVESPLDAELLARSTLQTLLEGMYEGSGSCPGNPLLRAGSYVKVGGVGDRFSGTYRLRKVTHTLDDGGYRTDFEITQRTRASLPTLLRKRLVEDEPPDKPALRHGVYVGEVAEDTELAGIPPAVPVVGRVRVKIPQFGDDFVTDWAPCVMPMAGADLGTYFLPKNGDQVLVTFAEGDVKRPYVLGSLWNAIQPPPVRRTPAGVPDQCVIKSRAGHTIVLDDSASMPGITIRTGAGHTLVLDDSVSAPGVSIKTNAGHTFVLDNSATTSGVTIRTGAGHTLVLDDSGASPRVTIQDSRGSQITLDSNDQSVTIGAQANLTIKASGNVSIESQGKLEVTSHASLEIKSDGSISIQAGGPLKLQGTTIDLN